jgi:hypothetical protein
MGKRRVVQEFKKKKDRKRGNFRLIVSSYKGREEPA